MNWLTFAIAALFLLALDRSLVGALELGGVQPLSLAALAVFIALMAPKITALWACWIIGLLIDLGNPMAVDGGVHLIGPHALGFAFGGYLVVLMRTMVFRRRALTIGVMTLALLACASLVVTMILLVRSSLPGLVEARPMTSATRELGYFLMVAVYSGILAIPVGWLLVRTLPLWNFQFKTSRPTTWR